MNALLLAYKPIFISSNHFLSQIKRKYAIKKAGFSGTLDPFARGSLLIACGHYTKLLPFINTSPKVYKATLWLGAESKSLDIENFLQVKKVRPFSHEEIENALAQLRGEIHYTPPLFSAKKIQGIQAYKLARIGKQAQLKPQSMQVFDLQLLDYNHPFISFQAKVSKGAYIRSLADLIAKNLAVAGTLSSLERISEGKYQAKPNTEIFLNPLDMLDFKQISLESRFEILAQDGKKFQLKNHKSGIYIVKFDKFFSIIHIQDNGDINYLLNRIQYAHTL